MTPKTHHCFHCKEPIERTHRALWGWQHVSTGMVCCLQRAAKPMSDLQETVWNCLNRPTDLLKFFGELIHDDSVT